MYGDASVRRWRCKDAEVSGGGGVRRWRCQEVEVSGGAGVRSMGLADEYLIAYVHLLARRHRMTRTY